MADKTLARAVVQAFDGGDNKTVYSVIDENPKTDNNKTIYSDTGVRFFTNPELVREMLAGDDYEYEFCITSVLNTNKPSYASNHRPVLDLDVPVYLVPSTTPGHSHLYIDVEMSRAKYEKLIGVLQEVGIIEPGFANQMVHHGCTMVRLPGVTKGEKYKREGAK